MSLECPKQHFSPQHMSYVICLPYTAASLSSVIHLAYPLPRVFAFLAKNSGLLYLLPTKEHFLEYNLTTQFDSIPKHYISIQCICTSQFAIKKEIWSMYPLHLTAGRPPTLSDLLYMLVRSEGKSCPSLSVFCPSQVFLLPCPSHWGISYFLMKGKFKGHK